jgi:hypothetical protein
MGVNYNNMADTKIATSMAAFFVPHECLSGAKIDIIREISKTFWQKIFKGHKNNRSRPS